MRDPATLPSLLVLALVASARPASAAGPPRRARDWSALDLDRLEAEWEEGDEEEELVTADEELYRVSERRRGEAMERLNRAMAGERIVDSKEFERLADEAQRAGKPAMIFAKVRADRAPDAGGGERENGGWDWDSLAKVCGEWQYHLEFKMVDITCYPMEPDSILVTVKRGWDGDDVFDYLSQQDVLAEVSWDGKKANPGEVLDLDNEL